ncbi:MAG: hypothetical protein ABI417_12065 [Coleofasciculaceae cyanobacterium]
MQTEDNLTQVTFYYLNGQSEAFDLSLTPEDFAAQLPGLLNQSWLTLHLFDRTILICTAKIMKVEVKPDNPQILGEAAFLEAQRVTALTHSVKS